ncbi:HAD-IA family hydrolase [Streptomyces sp. NPDC058308]|uniref:HAD-IA family hydrolase n=1 Tax=Streptomyces sp. NPDC058308 TaxID=3346440 RepID=UPI0036E82FFE
MGDESDRARPCWLLSDFAGVLARHQPEADRRRMAAVADAEFAPFWTAYWSERDAYDTGSVSRDEYWTKVAARLGAGWSPCRIATLDALDVDSWLYPDHETLSVVGDAVAAGMRLAVLSNAPLSLAAALRGLTWLAPFEHVICSSEIRAAKPGADCYRTALGVLGAGPADVVFVDDREANVTGARALGIRSVLFSGASGLSRALSV